MERTEIDGVPVLWADLPGPLSASLIIGCGHRDETFETIGITHLVQQLAMAAIDEPACRLDGFVDQDCTMFTVEGSPDAVAEGLGAVCRALARLPLERLAETTAELDPDERHSELPTATVLYDRRFGRANLGLMRWPGYGYESLTEEQVRGHAARFFVAGNAVLYLTGPPPGELRLPLPTGPRVAHPAPPAVRLSGPRWSEQWGAGVGLMMRGEDGVEWAALQNILHSRLRRFGSCYREAGWYVDETACEFLLTVDVKPAKAAAAAETVWRELQAIAAGGATPAEVTEEIEATRAALATAGPPIEGAALALLLDQPNRGRDTTLAELATLTPARVAAAAAEGIRTALMVVPYGVRPELPGMIEDACPRDSFVPAGRAFPRSRLAGLFGRGGERLVLASDGVARVDSDGAVHFVRYADMILVEQVGAARVVFGSGGCVVPVDPMRYPGAASAVRAVDEALLAQARVGTGG